jgi:hypothetical protein
VLRCEHCDRPGRVGYRLKVEFEEDPGRVVTCCAEERACRARRSGVPETEPMEVTLAARLAGQIA